MKRTLIVLLLTLLLFASSSVELFAQGTIHGPVVTWTMQPETSFDLVWLETIPQKPATANQWTLGYGGFGFADNDDFTDTGNTKGNRIYLRRIVKIGQWAKGRQLIARVRYDDGLLLFADGNEVLRCNIESGRGAEAKGIQSHEANRVEEYVVGTVGKEIAIGDVRFAAEIHNRSNTNNDLTGQIEFVFSVTGGAGRERKLPILRDDAPWEYFTGTEEPETGWENAPVELEQHFVDQARRFEISINDSNFEPADTAEVDIQHRPFGDAPAIAWSAKITGLSPASSYTVELVDRAQTANTARLKVTTAPSQFSQETLRFVTGGDMFHNEKLLDAMNARAGKSDPMFALLGGDLAYSNSLNHSRWFYWLDSWKNQAVTSTGDNVPMVVGIGNHEVHPSAVRPSPEFAPLFYSLFRFPQPEKSNYTITFGEHLAIVLLDSHHSQRVKDQANWLKDELERYQKFPWLFACYHRPTFGTGTKKNDKMIRKHWCPTLEKYQVDAVFENDHHVMKRTFPVTSDSKRDPINGIPYFGDGAWGVFVRELPTASKDIDYLAKYGSKNHLWIVDLTANRGTLRAVNAAGEVLDKAVIPVARAK